MVCTELALMNHYLPLKNPHHVSVSLKKPNFFVNNLCISLSGAFGQVRGPQPGYAGPYAGQQNYGAPSAAPAPAPSAPKRLDPDSIPGPV